MLNCGGKIDQNVLADDHLRQDVCMGMLSRRQRKRWEVASDLMEKYLHHWSQVDFARVPFVNWRFPATQFLKRVRTKRVQIFSSLHGHFHRMHSWNVKTASLRPVSSQEQHHYQRCPSVDQFRDINRQCSHSTTLVVSLRLHLSSPLLHQLCITSSSNTR